MRAQKAALDQLMRAIDVECGIMRDREKKKRLATLKSEFAEPLARIQRLRADLEEAENAINTFGLSVEYDGTIHLTLKTAEAIDKTAGDIKRKFETLRKNMVVRFAIADESEKQFLIRNFFNEVGSAFPNLKALVGQKGKDQR